MMLWETIHINMAPLVIPEALETVTTNDIENYDELAAHEAQPADDEEKT